MGSIAPSRCVSPAMTSDAGVRIPFPHTVLQSERPRGVIFVVLLNVVFRERHFKSDLMTA
jgi:hypothetical protein